MKQPLLLLLTLIAINCFAQQKLSGTVTYYYNQYQGNKADVGASIYILPATDTSVNFSHIDSLIWGEFYYTQMNYYLDAGKETDAMLRTAWIGKKRRAQLAVKIPDDIQKGVIDYNVATKTSFDSMENKFRKDLVKFIDNEDAYTSKADGVGNYSFNIKQPGEYYVLIQSANRQGSDGISSLGFLHLEKIKLKEGDEKNVSNNFSLNF